MRARPDKRGGSSRDRELDVARLDIACLREDGETVRPILTVVSERRTRMIVEAIVSFPSKDGPATA